MASEATIAWRLSVLLASAAATLGASTVLAPAADQPSRVDSLPPERGPGQLVISGGRAPNRMTADLDASNRYVVSDEVGVIAGQFCTSVSPYRVVCSRAASPELDDIFTAGLGDGNDRFVLLADSRSATVKGGAGDDTIIDSDAKSDVLGENGDDVLRGKGGHDRVFAGRGHDRLYGGPGPDRLDADDHDVDRIINCGGGQDVAHIDRNLDPKPRHCERVIRR